MASGEGSESGTKRWSTINPRPILPAASRNKAPVQNQPGPPGPLSPVACDFCRRRKTKCGRTLPRCSICVSRGLDCVYQQPSAERDEIARRERDDYQQLFDFIRTKRDRREVDDIVRRIQSGHPAADIVRQIKDGDLLLHMSLVPDARFPSTFQYISEMPYYLLNENTGDRIDGRNRDDNNHWHPPMPNNDRSQLTAVSSESARVSSTNTGAGPSTVRLGLQGLYVRPYHTAKLVEPILDEIKPSTWTRVSTNDAFMIDLLRMYLLSQYPYYPHFHKDYFLRSMKQQRRKRFDGDNEELPPNDDNDSESHDERNFDNRVDSRYCSPLLLNSILAVACHSMRVKSPTEAKDLGKKFLKEAMILWDEEDSDEEEEEREEDQDDRFAPPSPLTRIHAGMVLFLSLFMDGSDATGWRYLVEATQMATNMRLMEDEYGPGAIDSTPPLQGEKAVRLFTAWSIYSWQGQICFHFHRAPLIENPPKTPLPDALRNSEWYGEVFVQYPGEPELTPSYFGLTLQYMTELRSIVTDIAVTLSDYGPGEGEGEGRTVSGDDDEEDPDEEMRMPSPGSSKSGTPGNLVNAALICGLFIRLQEWRQNLPAQLRPEHGALPSHLKAHMHYHNVIIRLMQPAGDTLSTSRSGSSSHRRHREKRAADITDHIVSRSRKEIEALVRLYFLRHDLALYDPLITPFYSDRRMPMAQNPSRAPEP